VADALAHLHAALDDLLGADRADLARADLPALVEGLVTAGHRLYAASLDAVGAFDAAEVAGATRHRSTRRWLEHRTRVSAGQAAGLVASARAVRDHLPATRAALAQGQVSAQHVGAITHVVRTVGAQHATQAEPVLLDLARRADPSVVRRAAAHLHAVLDPDGAQAVLDRAYDRRGVTVSLANGRAYLDGVLDVESAETLQAALMPLMAPSPGDGRSAPQRRADALVDLARRALDAGDLPVLGGQRPHLTVVVPAQALSEGRGAATLPWTGVAVPAATVLRWGCDATLTPVWAAAAAAPRRGGVGGGWQPLAVGRSSRTVTPAQLRALQVRDGGCAYPGCSRTAAFCDAHHIRHWADGGPTDLDNLVLLCRHHHRTLHRGHWQIRIPDWVAELPGGHTEPLQTAVDRSPPLCSAG
jgi:hypothetical protein